jgi:hypothetical protein
MGREQFSGPVDVRWLSEHERDMMLLADLTFTDSNSVEWTAYKWDIIDGASIPKFLWEEIGSPFIGFYRRASVIHDVECKRKTRPWQDVHNCFYEMMMADGVEWLKAKIMYNAVYVAGPRW